MEQKPILQEPKMAAPTNIILWSALAMSQLAYLALPALNPLEADGLGSLAWLPAILGALAAVTGAGTLVYRQRALVGPIQRGELDPTTQEGFARAFPPFIINLVLSESIAVYGLVLGLLSGELPWPLAFIAVSLALMWVHRPFSNALVPPAHSGVHRPPPIG